MWKYFFYYCYSPKKNYLTKLHYLYILCIYEHSYYILLHFYLYGYAFKNITTLNGLFCHTGCCCCTEGSAVVFLCFLKFWGTETSFSLQRWLPGESITCHFQHNGEDWPAVPHEESTNGAHSSCSSQHVVTQKVWWWDSVTIMFTITERTCL